MRQMGECAGASFPQLDCHEPVGPFYTHYQCANNTVLYDSPICQ